MRLFAVWILGYGLSLLGGHYITQWVLDRIRQKTGCGCDAWKAYLEYANQSRQAEDGKAGLSYAEPATNPLSPGLQGVFERLFFTTVIAFDVSGAAVAMMAWFAVKMITNLNRAGDLPPKPITRLRALTGLQGALVSMTLALVGGLVCRFAPSLLNAAR